MLYHVLQRHPSFRPRKVNLHETHILSLLPLAFLFHGRKPRTLWRYMLEDDRAYRAFLRAIRPARVPLAALALPNLLRPGDTGALWRLSLAPDVLRAYFAVAARARGARRLVEKTPTNVHRAGQLVHAFPSCRLLYVARHPVRVLSSYRKRRQRDPSARWAAIDVDELCRRWEASARAAIQLRAADPDRLLIVAYERFTSEPEAQLQRVCAFLDEPYVPEALELEATEPEPWAADPQLFGPIVPEPTPWRDFVSPTEAKEIRRRLAPLIARLELET